MRATFGLLLVTTSRKPGSWWLKPLWSWRQTVEVTSRLSEETGRPPRNLPALLQPFGVLVEHGVDDVHEGLVGGEEAVAPGEQIAFQPALQGVLAEHLHDPAIRGEFAAVGILGLGFGQPGLLADLVDRGETVGGRFVRAEDAEVVRMLPSSRRAGTRPDVRVLAGHGGAWLGDLDRVVAEIGQAQSRCAAGRRW